MKEYAYIERLENAMRGKYPPEYVHKCTNYACKLLDKNLPVIFDWTHLVQILQLRQIQLKCYHVFVVRGKNKEREITAPSMELKRRQQWILSEILEKNEVSDCCHAFVKGRSIVTNATMHIGKQNILNLDIKNFFPSISQDRVIKVFEEMGYSKSASDILADICCYEGRLPQGAPTSPYLANLVLSKMDDDLIRFSKEKGLTYTRYADDMSFSSNLDIRPYEAEIKQIVMMHSFTVNEEKTKYYQEPYRKIVTGLVVKENKICVPKSFKRKLKQEIYYCKHLGVQSHLNNTGNGMRSGFKEYLYGKAYYVNMVEPDIGKRFLRELDEIKWGY